MTRSITCKNCSTQFTADLSHAPSNELTVACPKCGQKYKLRTAAANSLPAAKPSMPTTATLGQQQSIRIPITLAVSSGVAAIGTFLPWLTTGASANVEGIGSYSTSFGSSSGISLWHGELAFIAALATLFFFWKGQPRKAGFIAIAIPLVCVLGGLHASSAFDVGSSFGGASIRGSSSPGFGLLVTALAGIASSVFAFRGSLLPVTEGIGSVSAPTTTSADDPSKLIDPMPTVPFTPQPTLAKHATAVPKPVKPPFQVNRKTRMAIFIGAGTIVIGAAIWFSIELSKRHTLTTAERAKIDGWFKSIVSKQDWVVIQTTQDEIPELSFNVYRPQVLSDDGYGNVSIELAVALPPYAYDTGLGRFETRITTRHDSVHEPQQIHLCNEEPEGQGRQCLTWTIVSTDSMTIEFDDKEFWPDTYSVIPYGKFEAHKAAHLRNRSAALVRTVDDIAQGVGLLRRGSFRSYGCGDECGATFLEMRNGQPTPITYLCNNNRFGEVQLSNGDMIGEGDFTNQQWVGSEFLIASKQVKLNDVSSAWVIMGLLPFSQEQMSPELEQRLAVAANFDAAADGTKNHSVAAFASTVPVLSVKEVEQPPSFPGGEEALFDFLKRSVNYPEAEQDAGIQGIVYLTFVVQRDGSIRDVKTLRGVSEGLDREAMRAVRSMPRWTPGRSKGSAVDVQYNMPVRFTLR